MFVVYMEVEGEYKHKEVGSGKYMTAWMVMMAEEFILKVSGFSVITGLSAEIRNSNIVM
jgi:hypothetical protein